MESHGNCQHKCKLASSNIIIDQGLMEHIFNPVYFHRLPFIILTFRQTLFYKGWDEEYLQDYPNEAFKFFLQVVRTRINLYYFIFWLYTSFRTGTEALAWALYSIILYQPCPTICTYNKHIFPQAYMWPQTEGNTWNWLVF